MIDGFGTQQYIANLGHGITPNVRLIMPVPLLTLLKNMDHDPQGELDRIYS
jgi:uroporphyrinogen-III decarboxylase